MIDQSIALVVQSLVVKLPSFFRGNSQIGSQSQQDVLLKRLKYNDHDETVTINSRSRSRSRRGGDSVLDYLSQRETQISRSGGCDGGYGRSLQSAHQREFTFQGTDKIFASTFISDHEVLLSTKDNQLILLDTTTTTTSTSTSTSSSTAETGKKISLPVLYDNVVLDATKPSGLYGVECNYDKSVFATGTGDNSVMALYSVPEMAPYSVLKGHKDLVFCMDWFNGGGATRDVLVSGSRDTKVGVWKTPQKRKDLELELELVEPELLLDGHQCKVRAVKCSSSSTAGNDVVSLGSNGLLNVWDITEGCKKRESYQLVNGVDSLCMDVVNNNNNSVNGLYAVGSQSSVSLLDFRMHKACLHVFESLDETFGVRSLKFSNGKSLLTVGGGLGRIGFYDLRQCKYIEQSNHGRSKLYLRSGSGWVDNTSTTTTTTPPVTSHAIYTMAYNESNTSLFTAGGPLPFGAKGSYAAIWD